MAGAGPVAGAENMDKGGAGAENKSFRLRNIDKSVSSKNRPKVEHEKNR